MTKRDRHARRLDNSNDKEAQPSVANKMHAQELASTATSTREKSATANAVEREGTSK